MIKGSNGDVDVTNDEAATNMEAARELIEAEMISGPWVMGDEYTICDPYLFTLTRWLEGDGIDRARFPKVAAHFEVKDEAQLDVFLDALRDLASGQVALQSAWWRLRRAV